MFYLDFNSAVNAEQALSSIQGGDKYYDLSSGSKIQTESGWYRANKETVSYYLDPRNFLIPERILMFEDLGYNANYTTTVVQSILKGTFMEEYSLIDNKSYAEIFVEAGASAEISSVYLASLARQESGTKGSRATTGAEFTYKGVTYKNLYNFYNIGASSSAESPILAGLVWASGGSTSVIVNSTSVTTTIDNNINTTTATDNISNINSLTEENIISKLGVSIQNSCITNISIGTTLGNIKSNLSGLTVTIPNISDNDILKTGQVITITDGSSTFTYTISIKGDVNGDGEIKASDYGMIVKKIMEEVNLSMAQQIAADVNNDGEIKASDYGIVVKTIMER